MARRSIDISTPDGICRAGLFPSPAAPKGGVILFMDIFGPRASLDQMASRMAEMGYCVIVPDLFYRTGAYGPFDPKTAFGDEAKKAELFAMLGSTSQAMSISDSKAFLAVLEGEGARRVAAVGYCMGGARALNAAAAYPEQIAAAASFHGGNLATDAEDSPHNHAAKIMGRVYVGAATVDGSFPPEQAARLAEALRAAEVDHIIENYPGTKHGWCVPDHSAYDERGAERHWARLETLFAETLQIAG